MLTIKTRISNAIFLLDVEKDYWEMGDGRSFSWVGFLARKAWAVASYWWQERHCRRLGHDYIEDTGPLSETQVTSGYFHATCKRCGREATGHW